MQMRDELAEQFVQGALTRQELTDRGLIMDVAVAQLCPKYQPQDDLTLGSP